MDSVLKLLKPWTTLEDAGLSDDLSDIGLACLEDMRKLRRLSIGCGTQVTDAGVRSIGRLKNLDWLTIEHARITDACMQDIARLPRLKHLDLRQNRITDRGLAQLKGMKLEFLGLVTTKITDRGIDEIKDMTTLKRLEVVDTKVTNAALAKLKGIRDLQVWGLPREELHEVPDDPKEVAAIEAASPCIGVSKSNVTENVYSVNVGSDWRDPGPWMKHLKGLHNVKELELRDGRTTDDDSANLIGLRSLEKLEVDSKKFSDAGMKSIGTLTSLRELHLRSVGGLPRRA